MNNNTVAMFGSYESNHGMATVMVPDEVMEGLKILYREIRNTNDMDSIVKVLESFL